MSNLSVYGEKLKYKSEFDLLYKFLKIYATIAQLYSEDDMKPLRNRLIEVLTFYLMYGYSKKTKEIIKESLNIKDTNLNVMNSHLSKQGYIIRDRFVNGKYHLKPELLAMRDYCQSDMKNKVFLINLIK